MRNLVLLAAVTLVATPAAADSVAGRLAKMPAPEFSSDKSLAELKFCVASGISRWFTPTTVDGERRAFIYAALSNEITPVIIHSVLIVDEGERRAIAYYAPKAWRKRTRGVVEACL